MRTRRLQVSLAAFALAALAPLAAPARAAAAGTCDGIAFPAQVRAAGATLTLNGLGLRKATIFGIKVYVAALYLPRPTADAGAILAAKEPAEMRLRQKCVYLS